MIAANKTDLIFEADEDPTERLKKEFEPKGIKVFPISGVTGKWYLRTDFINVSAQLETMDRKNCCF